MKKAKGFTSIVSIFALMTIAMMVAIVSTHIGRAYTHKCYTQTAADAVANSIASYSSMGSQYDITMAEEMYNKLRGMYSGYNLVWNKAEVENNHIIIRAEKVIDYPTGGWSLFNILNREMSSTADVQLVPQTQLSKIKSAFPANKKYPVNPFVTGSPAKVQSNDRVLFDALLTQFYTEGRNRYRYSGEQDTVYGTMDAYHLLMGDVLKTLGYTPYADGFSSVGVGDTTGKGSDKPLTDGYVYIGDYKGHTYIVSNPKEKDVVTILYLDDTKEDAMSKLEVSIGEISNLRKSPSKWYIPKNEEEINLKENTIKIG